MKSLLAHIISAGVGVVARVREETNKIHRQNESRQRAEPLESFDRILGPAKSSSRLDKTKNKREETKRAPFAPIRCEAIKANRSTLHRGTVEKKTPPKASKHNKRN
jgi:hypothetical protein